VQKIGSMKLSRSSKKKRTPRLSERITPISKSALNVFDSESDVIEEELKVSLENESEDQELYSLPNYSI